MQKINNVEQLNERPWLEGRVCVLPRAGERVLDLGCRKGSDTAWLLNDGYEVVSVDKNEQCVAEVLKINPNNTFFFDMTNAKYWECLPENYFSTVIANQTLSKLKDKDFAFVINQIKRVLKPDGRLLARVNLAKNAEHGAMGGDIAEGYIDNLETGRGERYFSLGGAYSAFSRIGYVAVCPKVDIHNGKKKQIIEIVAQKEKTKEFDSFQTGRYAGF